MKILTREDTNQVLAKIFLEYRRSALGIEVEIFFVPPERSEGQGTKKLQRKARPVRRAEGRLGNAQRIIN